MTSRAIASSNQWKESTGPVVTAGRVIDDAVHSGFVTFAESGTVAGYMIDDVNHSGFVTADDGAGPADADIFIFSGGFAILFGR